MGKWAGLEESVVAAFAERSLFTAKEAEEGSGDGDENNVSKRSCSLSYLNGSYVGQRSGQNRKDGFDCTALRFGVE